MPHLKGVSTQAKAVHFRLLSRSAREREIEFGRDTWQAIPEPHQTIRSASFDSLEKAVLWLLQEGHLTAEILHRRGWVPVARLDFSREGFEDA